MQGKKSQLPGPQVPTSSHFMELIERASPYIYLESSGVDNISFCQRRTFKQKKKTTIIYCHHHFRKRKILCLPPKKVRRTFAEQRGSLLKEIWVYKIFRFTKKFLYIFLFLRGSLKIWSPTTPSARTSVEKSPFQPGFFNTPSILLKFSHEI